VEACSELKESRTEEKRNSLALLRRQIDRLDLEIIALLKRRQAAVRPIAAVKKSLGASIYDPVREEEVLNGLSELGDDDLPAASVRAIFEEIISAGRMIQSRISVAFLGPETSFSHEAALAIFGGSSHYRPAEDLEDVFELVQKGECGMGVIPIENSWTGSIVKAMDLLYSFPLRVTGEKYLRVEHRLMSREKELTDISKVFSHPAAAAQCAGWMKRNLRRVEIREVSSTSLAARLAAEEKGSAAIGNKASAADNGLFVLAENIQDSGANTTRFLVIGKEKTPPTGRDKTSIVFAVRHEPGSLADAIAPFAQRKINMMRIESRPIRTRPWEYIFYVDLEGHENDPALSEALEETKAKCSFIKNLGSYPRGRNPWD
jgi:chorismate mutase/prephenate dehydratase